MAITLYDFIEKDFVTKSINYYHNGSPGSITDDGYTYDGNLATATGISFSGVSNGNSLSVGGTYTFSAPISISYIGMRAACSASGVSDPSSTHRYYCYIKDAQGEQTEVFSQIYNNDGGVKDVEASGLSYTNVVEIRVGATVTAVSGYSGGGTILSHIYELSVNGVFDLPSKIRVRTSGGTKRLAKYSSSDLSLSPLHSCESSGVVSALRLVDTTSVAASPLRINTSDGVKSVALYSGDY